MRSAMDPVIGALIGLVRVCSHKERTESSDAMILRGLRFTALPGDPKDAEEAPEALVDSIHQLKHTISPGCAVCASPCGGTVDYDMAQFSAEQDTRVRALKQLLLYSVQMLALQGTNGIEEELHISEDTMLFLYRSLMAIGDDSAPEDLLALALELPV